MFFRPKPHSFWSNVRPVGAIADFRAVFAQAGRHRWRIALLAMATTWLVFSLVTHEEARILPRPPHIDYINSWHAGRSEAEIVAGNIANEKRKDELLADQARREEMVRGIYKSLGRAAGMDVDAIERQAKADDAAKAKADAARLAQLNSTNSASTPPSDKAGPTR